MKKILMVLFLMSIVGCKMQNHETNWKLIYKNDTQGNSIEGNKEKLIQLIRQGYPLRIGFGGQRPNDHSKSIEHVVDVNIVTITNQDEVFAQIHPIISQQPDLSSNSLKVEFRGLTRWCLIAGTNGYSQRIMFLNSKDSIINKRSRPAQISWFVKTSKEQLKNIDPLF